MAVRPFFLIFDMPIEIESNNKGKKTWVIEPGMILKTVMDRIGDQRLALDFYCSPDNSSGYVESRLLQVKTRYKLGPLRIGEKRTVETTERTDFSKEGEQFQLLLGENSILTATFRSTKLDL